jgi:hypothetical protein
LPDAQLAVLPGTTHVGVTRRPGELLALITPFLDALSLTFNLISIHIRPYAEYSLICPGNV